MKKLNGVLMIIVLLLFSIGIIAQTKDDLSGSSQSVQNDCDSPKANLYCPYWNVTYKVSKGIFESSVEVTCSTGGIFYCEIPE